MSVKERHPWAHGGVERKPRNVFQRNPQDLLGLGVMRLKSRGGLPGGTPEKDV